MKHSIRNKLKRLGVFSAIVGAIAVSISSISYIFSITSDFAVRLENTAVSSAVRNLDEEVYFLGKGLKNSVPGEENDIFNSVYVLGDSRSYDYSAFAAECASLGDDEMVFGYVRSENLALAAYNREGTVLIGELNGDYFDYAVASMTGDKCQGFMVNSRTGNILLCTDRGGETTDLKADELYTGNLEAAKKGEECRTGGILSKYVIYSVPLNNAPYCSVFYIVDGNSLYGKGRRSLANMLITFVVVVIGVLHYSTRSANRIANSIIPTVECLDKFSQGIIDTDFKPEIRNDELGLLSEAMKNTISRIGSYIKDIDNVLSHLSEGDLTVQSSVEYRGEFVSIKNSLDNITASLQNMLSTIRSAGEQVNMGIGSLADGAQLLAVNSSTEAETLKNLDTLLKGINSNVTDTADKLGSMRELSEKVVDNVNSSNNSMQELSRAIEDIRTASSEITSIAGLIDDIAFQTNILALNAAVEAARAGAAGKGFAVVADEVRNLAGKSAEAAQNAVIVIGRSSEAVEQGVALNRSVTESLEEVRSSVDEFSRLVNLVADSSAKQAKNIGVVKDGLSDITCAVEKNAATAEESAASTQQVATQAHILENQLKAFNIRS